MDKETAIDLARRLRVILDNAWEASDAVESIKEMIDKLEANADNLSGLEEKGK